MRKFNKNQKVRVRRTGEVGTVQYVDRWDQPCGKSRADYKVKVNGKSLYKWYFSYQLKEVKNSKKGISR